MLRYGANHYARRFMEYDANPYAPPSDMHSRAPVEPAPKVHRGPLLYFAVATMVSVILAIPLIVPKSMAAKDDPNPIGYLLMLISFPVGGLVYRLRSRKWRVDSTARSRQIMACCATLLLPLAAALMSGMRGQGFHMTMLSGFVSLILMSGILIAGRRRGRSNVA